VTRLLDTCDEAATVAFQGEQHALIEKALAPAILAAERFYDEMPLAQKPRLRKAMMKFYVFRANSRTEQGKFTSSAKDWGEGAKLAPDFDRQSYEVMVAYTLARSGDHRSSTSLAARPFARRVVHDRDHRLDR